MNDLHNPKLIHRAQKLRREMTPEERHLWYDFLKSLPISIKRQKVIGGYIVDFYCPSAKLVIEIDGTEHYLDHGMSYDAKRDAFLQSHGLTIKRYSNDAVNQQFDSVCQDIYNSIFLML